MGRPNRRCRFGTAGRHEPGLGGQPGGVGRLIVTVAAASERLLPRDGSRARLAQDQLHTAVKAVVASGVAWELGRRVAPAPDAYYAPITALAAIYPTVGRSLRETGYYGASVVAGVLLAMAAQVLLGPSVWGVISVVGVGLLLGGLRWFGRGGGTMAFWALLVLVVGGDSPTSYLRLRLPEVALGLAVGVVVNLLGLPRLRLAPAERGLRRLRADLAAVLAAMASDLTHNWPPRDPPWARQDAQLEYIAAETRAAVGRAADSMRWNPRSRSRGRRSLERRDEATLDGLGRITTAVRAIVRTLDSAGRQDDTRAGLDESFRTSYAMLLGQLSDPVRGYGGDQQPAQPTAATDAGSQLERLEGSVDRARHDDPRCWLSEALLLIELGQIRAELAEGGAELVGLPQ